MDLKEVPEEIAQYGLKEHGTRIEHRLQELLAKRQGAKPAGTHEGGGRRWRDSFLGAWLVR
jgi:hypothetical protein